MQLIRGASGEGREREREEGWAPWFQRKTKGSFKESMGRTYLVRSRRQMMNLRDGGIAGEEKVKKNNGSLYDARNRLTVTTTTRRGVTY